MTDTPNTKSVAIEYTAHAINHRDGGTVVLLGSLGTTQDMWEPQVAALSEKYQVITPDVRGHGDSPAPEGPWTMSDLAADVVAILDEEGIDRAHFVGLSLGGAIAQTIALEHPDRVESLTLSSTAPKFGTPEVWQDKAELVLREGTKALVDGVVHNWFTDACFDTNPDLPARFATMVEDCPDAGYAGCCGALATFDTRDRLAEISAPTLVIAGKQDTSTAIEVVTSLHDGIPGSRMVVVSPAKHLLSAEVPEYYTAALLAHIDSVAG
nr:3-oxoadipate enol-lactonase [Corynebacterium lactis]